MISFFHHPLFDHIWSKHPSHSCLTIYNSEDLPWAHHPWALRFWSRSWTSSGSPRPGWWIPTTGWSWRPQRPQLSRVFKHWGVLFRDNMAEMDEIMDEIYCSCLGMHDFLRNSDQQLVIFKVKVLICFLFGWLWSMPIWARLVGKAFWWYFDACDKTLQDLWSVCPCPSGLKFRSLF